MLVIALTASHVELLVLLIRPVLVFECFNQVRVLVDGREFGGKARIALNIVLPVGGVRIKSLDLEVVAEFLILRVDQTFIRVFCQELPYLHTLKVIDIIERVELD